MKILGIGACVVNIPFIAQSSVGAKAPRQDANFIISTHKKGRVTLNISVA